MMKAFGLTLVMFIAASACSRAQALQELGNMAPLEQFALTNPKSISPDGTVVVGFEIADGGRTEFSWTAEDGYVELDFDAVNAVESSDPRIYLGTDNEQPFRLVDGMFQPPVVNDVVRLDERLAAVYSTEGEWETVDGGSFARVNDVSGSGSVFVGVNFSGARSRAAVWTEDDEFLIPEIEGATYSEALAVSADGMTVVGYADIADEDFLVAWIWTEAIGMRPVRFLLDDLEVGYDPLWDFEKAIDVSSDGTTIVGNGCIDGERLEMWLLKLTPDKIVVNSTGDSPRQAGGNSCFTGATIPGGAAECTLRSAIQAVNAGLGSKVEFDIPGGGVPMITPSSPLPTITESIELDATTQPGAGRVCIDGQLAGAAADGLRLMGGEAQVRGFEVTRFGRAGIHLGGGANHKILGNLIGTNIQGLAGLGNKIGIFVENLSGVLVGGVADGECNVISGNEDGLIAQNCISLKLFHNFFGAAPDGNTPLPNTNRSLYLKAMGGVKIGNSLKPTPVIGFGIGGLLEDVQNFTVENLHVGVGSDGDSTVEGQMEGICLEDCSDGQLIGGIYAGVSGTSVALVNSNRIKLEGVNIGTNANGIGSLIGNIGLSIIGGGGHEIGKFGGELTVCAGKLAVSLKELSGAFSSISNVHIGVDHAGENVIGDTETGLLIENSSNVKIEGKQSNGGGLGTSMNSLIAGLFGGVEIKNSSNIVASQLSVNTDATGQIAISLPPVGVLLESISKIDFGSVLSPSLINGITGLKVEGLSGSDNRFTNLTFNLNANGDAPLTDLMDCAISMDNCFQVVIDSVEVGKAVTGIEIDQSGDIEINDSKIGVALAELPGIPVVTGIAATASDNIEVTGGGIFATTGIRLERLGGDLSVLQDIDISASGAANDASRAMDARSFVVGTELFVRNNTIGGVRDGIYAEEMTHMVITGNQFGIDDQGAANAIERNAVQIIGGSTNMELRGNTFKNNGQAAVRVIGSGNQVVVRDNVMTDNGRAIVRDVVDETLRTLDIVGIFQGSTHVSGSIQGEPDETLLVDFYAYDPAAGAVEARYYLGAATVILDASGNANFAEVFAPSAPAGWNATATVTNAEFGTGPLSPGMGIAPALDSDNDGFPDTWEALYPECFAIGVVDPANEDCDNDGLSSLEEFLYQTHPGVADVPPQLVIRRVEDGVLASIEAKPGRRYTLEFSPDFTAGSWVAVRSENVIKAGSVEFLQDGGERDGFFRMRLSLP